MIYQKFQISIINSILIILFYLSPVVSKAIAKNLPSQVDNSKTPHFREIFKQNDGSCGDASGVGMVFTYEINAARGVSSTTPENLYPYSRSRDQILAFPIPVSGNK